MIEGETEESVRDDSRKTVTRFSIALQQPIEKGLLLRYIADLTICLDMLREYYQITDGEMEGMIRDVLFEKNKL